MAVRCAVRYNDNNVLLLVVRVALVSDVERVYSDVIFDACAYSPWLRMLSWLMIVCRREGVYQNVEVISNRTVSGLAGVSFPTGPAHEVYVVH
jgi:hypothetical protein